VPERDLEIRESDVAVLRRHELLALDGEQQVEHALVEHLPRPDLLLDHVNEPARR
jgi:hypothetical protein